MNAANSLHGRDGRDRAGGRPLTALDDRELVAAHVAGHPGAFGEIARRHYGRLWRFAMTRVRNPDDADDVIQLAMERAMRSASTFRGDAAVTTWLHRIVANCAVDLMNSRRAHRTAELDHDVAAPDEGHELAMDAKAAVDDLPPSLRSAFELVALDGFTQTEAATMLGVPHGTVKTWVWRARARIAQSLYEPPATDLGR